MPSSADDFDLYEKAAYYLVDPPEDPEASYEEPETCPVRIKIYARGNSIADIQRKLSEHRWEFCEECGQTTKWGFRKPATEKKAA